MAQYLTTADILQFDFDRQQANYELVQKALWRNKLRLQEMELDHIPGHGRALGRTFVTFKAYADNRKICWNKYECGAHGAGQNHITIYGRRMKLSEFVRLSEATQDELLQSPTSYKDERAATKAHNKILAKRFADGLEGFSDLQYATIRNPSSSQYVCDVLVVGFEGKNLNTLMQEAHQKALDKAQEFGYPNYYRLQYSKDPAEKALWDVVKRAWRKPNDLAKRLQADLAARFPDANIRKLDGSNYVVVQFKD